MACKAYYDPRCEALAREYLRWVADAATQDAHVLELAGAIQETIESWWQEHRPTTEWLDETLPAPANPLKFPDD